MMLHRLLNALLEYRIQRQELSSWSVAGLIVGFLLTGCGESASLAVTAQTGPEPPRGKGQATVEPMVFRKLDFTDPGMAGMLASSLLVPEDWTVEGGLQRMPPQLFAMPVVADVNISAPDGRGVHIFPAMNFSFGQSMRGLQIMQPTINGNPYYPLPKSVGSWVLELATKSPDPAISGLRLVKEEPVPEVTQQLRQAQAQRFATVEQHNRQYAYFGISMSFDTQATRLVFAYQKQGRQIEETMLVHWEAELNMTKGQVTQGQWAVSRMTSMRGPVGVHYLEDPILAAIINSVQVNPAWAQEMQKYWSQLAQIQHKGRMERLQTSAQAQRKLSQTYSEIGDIVAGGWRSRSASMDRMQERSVDAIWDQTPYTTPEGGTVKLPSFYDHVYSDGNGRYLMHNDALWNPNRDRRFNGRDWQRLGSGNN